MNFQPAVRTCLSKYATFAGRASRSEFWWFALFYLGISAAIVAIRSAVFGPTVEMREGIRWAANGSVQPFQVTHYSYDGGMAGMIFSIITACPLIAVSWRRLHDTGRSGWMGFMPLVVAIFTIALAFLTPTNFFVVLSFISILIAIVFLTVMLTQKSVRGSNPYGPNPNEVTQ